MICRNHAKLECFPAPRFFVLLLQAKSGFRRAIEKLISYTSTYQHQQSNLSQNNYIASFSGCKVGCVVKQLLGFIVQINRMMQCAQQSGLLPGVRCSTNLRDSLFAHPFRYIQEKIICHTNEYISLFFSSPASFFELFT